jgi:hypothetical protein
MSNSRNIEIGIFFILLLALYCYENRSKWFEDRTRLKVAGIAILYAVLCANDPMFSYLTLIPFALLVVAFYFFGKLKLQELFRYLCLVFVVVISTFIMKLILMSVLSLKFYAHPGIIAPFNKVAENVMYFFGNGIGILGIDIFGKKPTETSCLLGISMLVVTALAISGFVYSFKKERSLFSAFLLVLWVWIPAVCVVSSLTVTGEVGRYLILLPLLVPLGLVFAIKNSKLMRQMMLISAVLIFALVTRVIVEA